MTANLHQVKSANNAQTQILITTAAPASLCKAVPLYTQHRSLTQKPWLLHGVTASVWNSWFSWNQKSSMSIYNITRLTNTISEGPTPSQDSKSCTHEQTNRKTKQKNEKENQATGCREKTRHSLCSQWGHQGGPCSSQWATGWVWAWRAASGSSSREWTVPPAAHTPPSSPPSGEWPDKPTPQCGGENFETTHSHKTNYALSCTIFGINMF